MQTSENAGGSSRLRAIATSASLGSVLGIVGIPAAVSLGEVSSCFALGSSGFIIASKKLEVKIAKHQEVVTLALAKCDMVDHLLSKAIIAKSRL